MGTRLANFYGSLSYLASGIKWKTVFHLVFSSGREERMNQRKKSKKIAHFELQIPLFPIPFHPSAILQLQSAIPDPAKLFPYILSGVFALILMNWKEIFAMLFMRNLWMLYNIIFPKEFFLLLPWRSRAEAVNQPVSQPNRQPGRRERQTRWKNLLFNTKHQIEENLWFNFEENFLSSNFFFFPKPLFPFFPLIQSRVEEANIWIHNFKVSTAFLSIFLRFSDSLFFIWIYSAATRRENSSYWFIDC